MRGEAPALGEQDDEQEERPGEPGREQRQARPRAGGRARPSRPGSGRGEADRRATSGTSRSSGSCTRKIDCQLKSSVSSPPSAGPTATPIVPAAPQSGAASSWRAARAAPATRSRRRSSARRRRPGRSGRRSAPPPSRPPRTPADASDEDRHARPPSRPAGRVAGEPRGGQDRQRENQVEGGQHPGDADDGRVELAQDVGQRQRDDRASRRGPPRRVSARQSSLSVRGRARACPTAGSHGSRRGRAPTMRAWSDARPSPPPGDARRPRWSGSSCSPATSARAARLQRSERLAAQLVGRRTALEPASTARLEPLHGLLELRPARSA